MAIFKKLNDNHQNIPNDELWDRAKYNSMIENGFGDYTRLNSKFYAKSVFESIDNEDDIVETISKFWRAKNDNTFDVLVLHRSNVMFRPPGMTP